jgi:hypothetical protein
MRKALVAVALLFAAVGVTHGQVPQTITYQGLLTDDAGAPVPDGTYTLTFFIYDTEDGGEPLWGQEHPSVLVAGGLFKAVLGEDEPIPLEFDAPYWLEVRVEAEPPQEPRIRLTSAPYSFRAMDADQVDGFDAYAEPAPNALLALDATGQFPSTAIPPMAPSGAAGGDLTGTYPNPSIADDAVTVAKIAPDVLSSIDGVSNDGGDVDLIAGANITITPDDGANAITIGAAGGAGGDITSVWPANGTLTGGADQGDVTLAVANPLELTGSADGVIKGTQTGGTYGYLGGTRGVYAEYGTGNRAWLAGYGEAVYGQETRTGTGNQGALGTRDEGAWGYHGAIGNYGRLGTRRAGVLGFNNYNGAKGSLGDSLAGVYGDDGAFSTWAGFFGGDVYVSGSVNKSACSFLIDHPLDPENRLLRHNCVESPEHLLIYRGKSHLDAEGEAVIEMPEYFVALTKEDRATVTVTPVGKPFLVGYEWQSDHTGFLAYGDPDREVSWVVYAERDDSVIRELARPVEEDKGPDNKYCDRGQFLHPTAYGYPESMGRGYEARQRALRRHESMIEHRAPSEAERARKTGVAERTGL